MANFFSPPSRLVISNRKIGRDEVYVASVPLRAAKGPAQLLMSTAYSLNLNWNLQHFMVLIKPSSPLDSYHQALVYDFQPEEPENISVAIAALSGGKVPGVILVRKIGKLPKKKCWFIGHSKENAIELAHEFNESWEMDLKIGSHDCRNYTEGLVDYLTGKKSALKNLKETSY